LCASLNSSIWSYRKEIKIQEDMYIILMKNSFYTVDKWLNKYLKKWAIFREHKIKTSQKQIKDQIFNIQGKLKFIKE
jgi:hypothetical protein